MAIKSSVSRGEWRAISSGIPNEGTNVLTRDELVTSVSINPGGENPFLAWHATLTGSIGRNVKETGTGSRFLKPGPSSFGDISYLNVPVVSWSAANLWARSHPLRPVVKLPVFWLELRDIPDMIRQAGRFLLAGKNWRRYVRRQHQTRDLATANLAFQFGWVPLIGDLYKLAHFQDEVDKRRKRLVGGTKGGVFRTSFSVGSASVSGSGNGFANFGSFTNFAVPFKYSGNTYSWATMKWKATTPGGGIPSKDDDLRPYLLGLHPSQMLSNVWEALPWSWLVDYFSNIGDLVDAGNHHTVTPGGGSVMSTSKVLFTHNLKYNFSQTLVCMPGQLLQVAHRRSPASSSSAPTLSMPSLGTGQLSILGSLALIKGGKRLGLS